MNIKFRFEDLEIWQDSIALADELLDIADLIESKHLYRFADQLRGSALSVSNNIAEGSGSRSDKEFYNFLNVAHRSAFENANILIVLNRRKHVDEGRLSNLLNKIDHLSRKITRFQQSLRN